MINWFDVIQPHADIRRGHFDEAVFAADLGDVYTGKAPLDYNDPYLFFKKTYLTAGLKGLLFHVHNKLTNGVGSSVVQIQTPFGGGKTHSLVTLYHYLKHGEQVEELLPSGLGLISPKISVIGGNHWNPVEGRTTEGITRYTFWGEVAYQIGGAAGYEQFRANDEARISPGKEKIRDFLAAHQPFILLFDEILEYINRALDKRRKGELDVSLGTQTFSFFQELTESVASLSHGMLVVTLPSSQIEDFGEKEEQSLARLGKIFGRLESIETPVRGQEIYAIIRRRLFEVESLKRKTMREIVHQYFSLYRHNRDDLPAKVHDASYRDKMELAYPFHPDLIDILYEKWSTFSGFQRTRGVLRLLANVVEELYQREANLDIILPGDINLEQTAIRQEFLKHIGSEYEGVIASDIAGHEAKAQALDAANRHWKHLSQRIATAIFYHSFSADDSEKGINLPYIKLAVLHSDTLPSLVTEVLQKQSSQLWYLNRRNENYYYSKIPNINRMILDKKELYNESYQEELERLIKQEAGKEFRTYIWPSASRGDEIADNRELKLIILHPEERGENIPDWIKRKGRSFREYQNTLFFALADAAAFARLREEVKTYLALEEIKNEIKREPNSPLATKLSEIEQRQHKIKRDYSYHIRRMYDTLQVGTRQIKLGHPVSAPESLSRWCWRELTSRELIIEKLHYRILVTRLMRGDEQLATNIILDQFYKNTRLPAPATPQVIARAIQLGVQEGAYGFATSEGGEISANSLHYQQPIPLSLISFANNCTLISKTKSETITSSLSTSLAEEEERQQQELSRGTREQQPSPNLPSQDSYQPTFASERPSLPPSPYASAPPSKYKQIRLVISDIPAGRIADVNRGIFMPLSAAVAGGLKFKLEIDITSSEGISPAILENQIKETIRQIGATIDEERVA